MSTLATGRPRLSTRARLQWDPLRGQQVLLFPEGLLVLNATAAAVLELCDGRHSVAEIAAELAARYGHPLDRVEHEVTHLLDRLLAKRLVEVTLDEQP